MKELIEISAALQQNGHGDCALATVIAVEGSAYRRPGARMLLTPDGRSWGMVSGGCLEHDVVEHARQVLRTGEARVVRYDSTSDSDILFGTGLGCKGVVDVLVEPVSRRFSKAFVDSVDRCRRTREPGAVATLLSHRGTSLRSEHAFRTSEREWDGGENLVPLLNANPVQLEAPFSLTSCALGSVFVQLMLPPVHLVIFGGWLDVIPLVSMAKTVGFQTTVVNAHPQPSLLPLLREADAVHACSPEDALSQIYFDQRTVAVSMNHHFERDQETIAALVRVDPLYIGLLGPKRRQQKLLDGLTAKGTVISAAFRTKIHGPAGLDLGAVTPEEIALSILAEILAVLNGRSASSISARFAPDGSINPDAQPRTLSASHA